MRSAQMAIAATLLALGAEACARPPDAAAIASLLWLPDEARILTDDVFRPVAVEAGRSIYIDGTGGVSFEITGDREALARVILSHFATSGWEPRPTQLLSPSRATSFSDGWERHCACADLAERRADSPPRGQYYSWHAEWDNEEGDILTYRLAGSGTALHGVASFLPLAVVNEIQRGDSRDWFPEIVPHDRPQPSVAWTPAGRGIRY